MRNALITTTIVITCTVMLGCHQPAPPHASQADIDAAQQDASREVAQAKAEASKDLKSAAKIAGPNSADVSAAKAVGKYDIAMVQADGDHKVATAKCLTLAAEIQASCKDHADSDYESAKAAAKASRMARTQ